MSDITPSFFGLYFVLVLVFSSPFWCYLPTQVMGDGAAIVAYIMKPSRVEDFAKVRSFFGIRLWNIIFMVIIAYLCWLYICFTL